MHSMISISIPSARAPSLQTKPVPSLQAGMRPQVLLLALAVLAVIATLPLAHGQGASPWPCCDKCGVCTKSIPPQCRCQDVSPTGCNSACKSCVRSTGGFQCADSITNFCQRRCTPAA